MKDWAAFYFQILRKYRGDYPWKTDAACDECVFDGLVIDLSRQSRIDLPAARNLLWSQIEARHEANKRTLGGIRAKTSQC